MGFVRVTFFPDSVCPTPFDKAGKTTPHSQFLQLIFGLFVDLSITNFPLCGISLVIEIRV
jgi:hypothetical protein